MIAPGTAAPPFQLDSSEGGTVSREDLTGKIVVLYFYPRDNTPGCTVEAQEFRDLLSDFRAAGAEVFGVSRDSIASHCKFRDKFGLTFPLLSDPEGAAMERYQAWGEKVMYGRKVTGVIRSTVVIDQQGKIARHWGKVVVKGHAAKVLEVVQSLAGGGAREGGGKASKASKAAKGDKGTEPADQDGAGEQPVKAKSAPGKKATSAQPEAPKAASKSGPIKTATSKPAKKGPAKGQPQTKVVLRGKAQPQAKAAPKGKTPIKGAPVKGSSKPTKSALASVAKAKAPGKQSAVTAAKKPAKGSAAKAKAPDAGMAKTLVKMVKKAFAKVAEGVRGKETKKAPAKKPASKRR